MKKYFLILLIINLNFGALVHPENNSTLNQIHIRFESTIVEKTISGFSFNIVLRKLKKRYLSLFFSRSIIPSVVFTHFLASPVPSPTTSFIVIFSSLILLNRLINLTYYQLYPMLDQLTYNQHL